MSAGSHGPVGIAACQTAWQIVRYICGVRCTVTFGLAWVVCFAFGVLGKGGVTAVVVSCGGPRVARTGVVVVGKEVKPVRRKGLVEAGGVAWLGGGVWVRNNVVSVWYMGVDVFMEVEEIIIVRRVGRYPDACWAFVCISCSFVVWRPV